MKRSIAAGLVALMGLGLFATDASADHRGHGRTRVIQSAPSGVDVNTLLLLGTLGGGLGADAGLSAMLPLLLAQPQTTTVIEERGRRWRGPRPAPTSRIR